MRIVPWSFGISAFVVFSALSGCAGDTSRSDTARAVDTTTSPPATPAPSAPAPTAGGAAASITPAMVALGDSIFHGRVAGGTCQTCHGQDAKGTTLAPNLTDTEWVNGDGSYQFLVNTITSGVLKPKKYPAAMPPMGGTTLTPAQIRAVAAYEYSLSHRIP